MAMNVSFEYLYRDGANYKNRGEVVFTTASGLNLEELERQIRQALIDELNFVAERAGIPSLYFSKWDESIDHTWHEYAGLSWTDESPTQPETIEQFIGKLRHGEKLPNTSPI
jgi:hypothetical protein